RRHSRRRVLDLLLAAELPWPGSRVAGHGGAHGAVLLPGRSGILGAAVGGAPAAVAAARSRGGRGGGLAGIYYVSVGVGRARGDPVELARADLPGLEFSRRPRARGGADYRGGPRRLPALGRRPRPGMARPAGDGDARGLVDPADPGVAPGRV